MSVALGRSKGSRGNEGWAMICYQRSMDGWMDNMVWKVKEWRGKQMLSTVDMNRADGAIGRESDFHHDLSSASKIGTLKGLHE